MESPLSSEGPRRNPQEAEAWTICSDSVGTSLRGSSPCPPVSRCEPYGRPQGVERQHPCAPSQPALGGRPAACGPHKTLYNRFRRWSDQSMPSTCKHITRHPASKRGADPSYRTHRAGPTSKVLRRGWGVDGGGGALERTICSPPGCGETNGQPWPPQFMHSGRGQGSVPR